MTSIFYEHIVSSPFVETLLRLVKDDKSLRTSPFYDLTTVHTDYHHNRVDWSIKDWINFFTDTRKTTQINIGFILDEEIFLF